MTARKLAVNVTVADETYEAGSTPPAEVAKLIDNPKAWGEEPDAEESSAAPKAPAKKAAPKKSE